MSQLRRALLYVALGFIIGQVTLPLLALLAQAQDYLVLTVRSYHFDRSRDYNENNIGIGYERRYSNQWSASVGIYDNSYNRTSVYALAAYTPLEVGGWRAGAVFGGVTGYENGVSPWLTGIATRDFGSIGINLILARSAVAVQLKIRIGR